MSTAIAALVWLTIASPQSVDDPDPVREFTELAQAAGLPAAANHPFVELTDGSYRSNGDGPPIPVKWRGLLLSDDGKRFTVLDERFCELTYERTGPDTPAERRVGYVPIDMLPLARSRLEKDFDWDGTFDLFCGWLCVGSGQRELAAELFERVTSTRKHRRNGVDFRTATAIDLGFARYEDLTRAFETRSYDDDNLLQRLDRWLQAFRDHELAAKVSELRAAVHTARDAQVSAEATQIEQLVHRLTETSGGFYIDDGWPFVTPVANGPRPADQLFTLGTKAVPELMRALEDRRPTRSVRGLGRRNPHSEVMRVDRVAHQILAAISGLGNTYRDPLDAKRDYASWWQRVAEVGVERELVARVEQGNRHAALRLLQVAPKLVAPAIDKALPRVDKAWLKKELTDIRERSKQQ